MCPSQILYLKADDPYFSLTFTHPLHDLAGNDGFGGSSGESIFNSRTPILGQKLYVLIIATVVVVLAVFLLIFWFVRSRSSRGRRIGVKHSAGLVPLVSEEIAEVNGSDQKEATKAVTEKNKVFLIDDVVRGLDIESGSKKGSSESKDSSTTRSDLSSALSASTDGLGNFGWGRWYSLRELQTATNQFSSENVIGEGGYGIVFRGVLHDGSVVAVKNLLNNKGQAEKEFKVEVEAIGKVKHKNLVSLIGYCAEGAQTLLVYEYIDNGNLEQWLHGDVGPVSPLTWEVRMKIAIGRPEGLEPKVVHRDVKSSNILLDRKWNPKVSDFGLAKLLGSEKSYLLHDFGVLLMEIITGRSPVDYSRPPGEMNLVDWFKGMVASRRDLDANKRPKMGQIVHMLEADEFPFRTEPRSVRDTAPLHAQTSGNNKIESAEKEVVNNDEERLRWR
ncbi:putative receptor-like serine/threonine-protein kinase [Sesamum angolense]|uniref:non-specific serine/threonine protein kinase n=1 Tax=Sesamum angolense TaxID=2727404 RepID=A0AAE1X4L2_9LAMI|nr:putative receptor-like serine/threonine-protein kinase [Sesamum angolense]